LLAFFAFGRSPKRPPYISRLLGMKSRNWKGFSHTKESNIADKLR
jgi:hypothetical protein